MGRPCGGALCLGCAMNREKMSRLECALIGADGRRLVFRSTEKVF